MVNCKKVIGSVYYMGGVMAVPEEFCFSLSQLIQYNYEVLLLPGETIWYGRTIASFHSKARNEIVNQFKGDWVLMLDTDHRFDPDILTRMIRIINKCTFPVDVLTGMYQYKVPPYLPNLFRRNQKGDRNQVIVAWEPETELLDIESSGAGCLFIRRTVFDRIKKELKQQPFDIIPGFGEDISFFKRCKKLGIKAYCAPKIEANHLIVKPLTLEDIDLSGFYNLEDSESASKNS